VAPGWAKRGPLKNTHLDTLEPIKIDVDSPAAIEEIFADVNNDPLRAAGKVLGYLDAGGDPRRLIDAARQVQYGRT